jgi:hypothetical protein
MEDERRELFLVHHDCHLLLLFDKANARAMAVDGVIVRFIFISPPNSLCFKQDGTQGHCLSLSLSLSFHGQSMRPSFSRTEDSMLFKSNASISHQPKETLTKPP